MAETRPMLLNEAVVRETEEVLGRFEQAIAEQNQKLDESFAKLIGAIWLISDNVNDVSSCGHLQQRRSSPVVSMTPETVESLGFRIKKIQRRISLEEIDERRSKGLCLFCEEPETPDHYLQHKTQVSPPHWEIFRRSSMESMDVNDESKAFHYVYDDLPSAIARTHQWQSQFVLEYFKATSQPRELIQGEPGIQELNKDNSFPDLRERDPTGEIVASNQKRSVLGTKNKEEVKGYFYRLQSLVLMKGITDSSSNDEELMKEEDSLKVYEVERETQIFDSGQWLGYDLIITYLENKNNWSKLRVKKWENLSWKEAASDESRSISIRCIMNLEGTAFICKNVLERIHNENLEILACQARLEGSVPTKLIGMDRSKRLGSSEISSAMDDLRNQESPEFFILLRYKCWLEFKEWFKNWCIRESWRKHKKIQLFTLRIREEMEEDMMENNQQQEDSESLMPAPNFGTKVFETFDQYVMKRGSVSVNRGTENNQPTRMFSMWVILNRLSPYMVVLVKPVAYATHFLVGVGMDTRQCRLSLQTYRVWDPGDFIVEDATLWWIHMFCPRG
ncbi:unnamed protein product [Arabidopsis lyrata]|nr:unnamed protein product [Arabidopsis lyrata]